MLQNNRRLHNRKTLRLKGYDYSSAGYYFITICCQDRAHRFGYVENEKMILNDAGKMVEKWYYEMENKYPDKKCHEMVIMPNHLHCLIENLPSNANCGCINDDNDDNPNSQKKYGHHNKILGATICDAMDWFKTMTTNEYIRGVKQLGWTRYNKKLWQRSYHDVINRTDYLLQKRKEYILNNPAKWGKDKLTSQ